MSTKSVCYTSHCGPVVKTGFHTSQYYVCQRCKSEITEGLAKCIAAEPTKTPKYSESDEIELAACSWEQLELWPST